MPIDGRLTGADIVKAATGGAAGEREEILVGLIGDMSQEEAQLAVAEAMTYLLERYSPDDVRGMFERSIARVLRDTGRAS